MRSGLNKFQRCPGCWNYIINLAIKQALQELNIPSQNTVVISGIWCSWKMSQYVNWYASETLHWRSIPFATWIKLANEKLTVIAYWGDWDGYGIGLGHLLHAARKDIDIVYIVADNENYALTTWQSSPTTPNWKNHNELNPFHPKDLVAATGCKFNVSISDKDIPTLKQTIIEAIQHKWFSHINIQQTCPTFKNR